MRLSCAQGPRRHWHWPVHCAAPRTPEALRQRARVLRMRLSCALASGQGLGVLRWVRLYGRVARAYWRAHAEKLPSTSPLCSAGTD